MIRSGTIISAGHGKKFMRKGRLDGGDRYFVTTLTVVLRRIGTTFWENTPYVR